MSAASGDITVDRLAEAGSSLEVVILRDARFESDFECGPRRPHRHDHHELVWTRSGTGRHLIDGEVSPLEPATLTSIGRRQVHVFERARGLHGAVVRSGDELLAAETRRPPDSRSVDVQRHLLSALLLWAERWYEATRIEQRDADDPDLQLYRRFSDALERDYGRHHDAPYYADALGVPQAALSRALVQVTGRATKELITDRRMLEAARCRVLSGRYLWSMDRGGGGRLGTPNLLLS